MNHSITLPYMHFFLSNNTTRKDYMRTVDIGYARLRAEYV